MSSGDLSLQALAGLWRVRGSIGLGLGWLHGLEGARRLLFGRRDSELALVTANLESLTANLLEMRRTLDAMHAQLQHCSPQ